MKAIDGFSYAPYRTGRCYDIGIYIRTPSGDRLKMFGGRYATLSEAKAVARRFNEETGVEA